MARLTRTVEVDRDGLDALRAPRTDLLVERADGPDRWVVAEGPFRHYERRLEVRATAPGGDRRYEVTETTDYKLAMPIWWPYLWVPMRLALAGADRTPRRRWWWPKHVVSAATSRQICYLGTVGTMAGYMGVLIGQTISFASSDFGVEDDVQANTLAAVRIGVLLSFLFLGRADRIGRKPLTIRFALAAILFTSIGAAAPNIVALGASQTVARGLTTGLLTLITLASTEEVPATARALAISFMTLTTGFGAALVVWVLRVADLFAGAWRLAYVVPLLFLPLLWWIARNLPETRRYEVATASDAPAPINWYRFALIAGAAFASTIYLSPASQLRNEFLRDDLGFTAGDVSTFQLLISLPATAAVPIGGMIADRYGRRWIGAGSLAVSAVFGAISFQTDGLLLWVTAAIGVSAGAASIPALRGYQTELFPTRARGRVGGMIDVLAVAGSALGLVVVGQLSVRWDDLGLAIAAMVIAPLLVAVLILVAFPETANRELEHFNPQDPAIEPGGTSTPRGTDRSGTG
ncbi:MAG: MFS transporter [Actinomycetota bacterium]